MSLRCPPANCSPYSAWRCSSTRVHLAHAGLSPGPKVSFQFHSASLVPSRQASFRLSPDPNHHRIFRGRTTRCAVGEGAFSTPVNVSQPAGPSLRHCLRWPHSVLRSSSRLLRRVPPLRKGTLAGTGQPRTSAHEGRINTGIKLSHPSLFLQTLDMSYQRFLFLDPYLSKS